ncbi:hypothetical protein RQP46_011377 [Phenoliferia psychrophenolica]
MLPPETQHPLQSLITALLQLTTSASPAAPKRFYSFLFRDLPDRHDYPDYYILIKEPQSLNGIFVECGADSLNRSQESVKKGVYSSPHAVAYDLFLVWSNAREYNQQGSQVYNDADKLEAYMQKLWNERSPPLPPFANLMRPGSLHLDRLPIDDGPSNPKRPKLSVKPPKHHKEHKDKASSSRAASPGGSHSHSHSHSSHSRDPDHEQRKKERKREKERERERAAAVPMPPPRLKLKLGGIESAPPSPAPSPAPPASAPTPNPTPASAPFVLKLSLPKPPPTPPPPIASTSAAPTTITLPIPASLQSAAPVEDSGLSPAALAAKKEQKRERKAKEKASRLAAKALEAELAEPLLAMDKVVFLGIPDEESGWMYGDLGPNPVQRYLDIIRQLRTHTDAQGRQLATPLLTLPDRATREDYYKLVPNPIALDVIETRAKAGGYATPEAFDRDLHHLFQVARLFIRPETPGKVFTDLIVLQRLYQELTKPVSHVSPANSHALGSLSSIRKGPGNDVQPTASASSPGGAVGDAEGGGGKGNKSGGFSLEGKVLLNGVHFKGQMIRVGDWVHILNPDNPAKSIIAQIFKVYRKDGSPQRYFNVCWYFRPEETVHPASRTFYENEVFKTGQFFEHKVEEFIERCLVLWHPKYVRGRPKPPYYTPGMPLYVCEHRYKETVKSFKKIKSWTQCVPDEIRKYDYEMDLFPNELVDALKKVKSPFVRGIAGPGGIGVSMEREEEEQGKYHFLPGGEPATLQKLKAVKEANDAAIAAEKAAERAAERAAAKAKAPASLSLYGSEPAPTPHPPIARVPPPARAAPAPPPAPVLPPPPPIDPTLTPAELAASKESFQPLPTFTKDKFRTNDKGDILWFVAPPLALPPAPKPHHSLDYLYWRAQKMAQKRPGNALNGSGDDDVDVDMTDASGP